MIQNGPVLRAKKGVLPESCMKPSLKHRLISRYPLSLDLLSSCKIRILTQWGLKRYYIIVGTLADKGIRQFPEKPVKSSLSEEGDRAKNFLHEIWLE